MSKSVRDCTIYNAEVHSTEGIVPQNTRCRFARIVRSALAALLCLTLSLTASAQTEWLGPDWWGGQPPAWWDLQRLYVIDPITGLPVLDPITGQPIFTIDPITGLPIPANNPLLSWTPIVGAGAGPPPPAPYMYLVVNQANGTGGDRYTAQGLTGDLALSGSVSGAGTNWMVGNDLEIAASGRVMNLETLSVLGSLRNAGTIFNIANVGTMHNLVNGTNGADRERENPADPDNNAARIAIVDEIWVGGNLVNYFDGAIRDVGTITVIGELYNAGAIVIDPGASGYWNIIVGNVFNDGRWDEQRKPADIQSGVDGEGNDNGAWGIISDANIDTYDLTNVGANAVIDGMVNTNGAKYMHIYGNLINAERAGIFNYGEVIVHGDFLNRGATFVGGHWTTHLTTDSNPLLHQVGNIGVWGNVINTYETDLSSGRPVFGGFIASFDKFDIHGSLINDAFSTVSGTYMSSTTFTVVTPGAPILDEDGNPVLDDDGNPTYEPDVTEGFTNINNVYGRRANIQKGVMTEGEYHDAPSILNVMAVWSNNQATEDLFFGLYNEGYIGEIDILSVGSSEVAVLWNALQSTTYDQYNTGVQLPPVPVLQEDGTYAYEDRQLNRNPNRPANTYGGDIYDIGVINAMNIVNEGTISEIDVAINVAFSLINTDTGIIDGLSTFHTEWVYDVDPLTGLGIGDTPGEGSRKTTTLPNGDVVPYVLENRRATLTVGKGVNDALNPLSKYLGTSIKDIGIINYGTITNFETITSLGHMYNYGSIGVSVQTNAGMVGRVTSIVVGSNMDYSTRADLYNFGTLQNIDGITVSGNIILGNGSTLRDIGTITAQNDMTIYGEINGGFRTLSATEGELLVTGSWLIDPITNKREIHPVIANPTEYASVIAQLKVNDRFDENSTPGEPMLHPDSAILTIEPGAVASGYAVRNNGRIINYGLLNSATGIENRGVIENNGMISAYNQFINRGILKGNGMVSLSGTNRMFNNEENGIISGGLTINGNFRNNGGTIVSRDTKDIMRVTNDGTATINGGLIDVWYDHPEVGKQYLFMSVDKPGNLNVAAISDTLKGAYRGIASGTTGSVLDVTPVYGYWDGSKYVAGKAWTPNQHYWIEYKRAYSYGDHAVTENQRSIGDYVDLTGVAPKPNSAFWNLLKQLDAISDDPNHLGGKYYDLDYKNHQGMINPAALRALEELGGGGIYSSIGVASAHNIGVVNRTLADALRSDVFKFSYIGNPNNAIRGQAIAPLRYTRWGTLLGIGGNTLSDGNADGYKQSFGGVMAGFDRALWTGTRIGAYLSAATGSVSMQHLSEKTDITNVMVGMYLRQEMYYGYGLVSAGFGMDNYKTERNLTMLDHRAEGKFNGSIGTLYLERGIDLPVYYATFQPYASFQVVSVNQDKFTERMWNQSGQYANIGLEGMKGQTNSYRMALGARAATTPVPMRWGQLAFTANSAWFHEFCDAPSFTGRFSNPGGVNFSPSDASFTVTGNTPRRDWVNIGCGLHIDRNSTRVFLNGDLFANDRQSFYSGGGGWIFSW